MSQRTTRSPGDRSRELVLATATRIAGLDGSAGLALGHLAEVVRPARDRESGLEQLLALCKGYLDYLRRRLFPGGCFFTSLAAEVGDLPRESDPEQPGLEPGMVLTGADIASVPHGDEAVLDRVGDAIRSRLQPSAGSAVVVGAAILDSAPGPGARLLAAQRRTPDALAGLWEFPGGKVEVGESESDALRRECREELGIEVEVLRRVGPAVPTGTTTPPAAGAPVLKVWLCRVVGGRPVAHEHAELRWLTPAQFDSVPWIAADAPVVTSLARLLT